MTNNTMTNKLNIKIDYGKLLKQYHIYKIFNNSKNSKEYKTFYTGIYKKIKPLAHAIDGKYTLVILMEDGLARKYSNDYEITQLYFTEIQREKGYILLRLLNSLLAQKASYFEIQSDAYGLYYLVDKKPSTILAIKISIDRDLFLSLNVTTFTKTKSLNDGYIIHENKLIKAVIKKEEEQLYKKGNYKNKKSSYPFLGLMKKNSEDTIQKSKVYVLIRYINEMKKYFKEIIEIDFYTMDINLYDSGKDAVTRKECLHKQIKQTIKSVQFIHIVNYTDTNLSK